MLIRQAWSHVFLLTGLLRGKICKLTPINWRASLINIGGTYIGRQGNVFLKVLKISCRQLIIGSLHVKVFLPNFSLRKCTYGSGLLGSLRSGCHILGKPQILQLATLTTCSSWSAPNPLASLLSPANDG